MQNALDASIVIDPERLLEPSETDRLQASGFYAELSGIFQEMGYSDTWVGPRGNGHSVRYLKSVAEISSLERRFHELDLTWPGPQRGYRLNRREEEAMIDALLGWGHRQDGRKWFLGCLEFRASSYESAAGIRWRTRRDVIVGPTSACSQFFAWLPKKCSRADWRRAEESGFFDRSSRMFRRLHQKGRWRPEVFHDSERYAAEFWRPGHDPEVAWRDFKALLDLRLT
jgi:hypothetical protein